MPSIEQLGSKYSYFDSEINSWVQSKDRTDDWLRVDEVAPGLTHEQASERCEQHGLQRDLRLSRARVPPSHEPQPRGVRAGNTRRIGATRLTTTRGWTRVVAVTTTSTRTRCAGPRPAWTRCATLRSRSALPSSLAAGSSLI